MHRGTNMRQCHSPVPARCTVPPALIGAPATNRPFGPSPTPTGRFPHWRRDIHPPGSAVAMRKQGAPSGRVGAAAALGSLAGGGGAGNLRQNTPWPHSSRVWRQGAQVRWGHPARVCVSRCTVPRGRRHHTRQRGGVPCCVPVPQLAQAPSSSWRVAPGNSAPHPVISLLQRRRVLASPTSRTRRGDKATAIVLQLHVFFVLVLAALSLEHLRQSFLQYQAEIESRAHFTLCKLQYIVHRSPHLAAEQPISFGSPHATSLDLQTNGKIHARLRTRRPPMTLGSPPGPESASASFVPYEPALNSTL